MEATEDYRGSRIDVFVSTLESGRSSFVIYIDGKMLADDIDGPDESDAMLMAIATAKKAIDKELRLKIERGL